MNALAESAWTVQTIKWKSYPNSNNPHSIFLLTTCRCIEACLCKFRIRQLTNCIRRTKKLQSSTFSARLASSPFQTSHNNIQTKSTLYSCKDDTEIKKKVKASTFWICSDQRWFQTNKIEFKSPQIFKWKSNRAARSFDYN